MSRPRPIRLALFFKDFSHWSRASCVGLNVAGYCTEKYLRHHGTNVHAFAVRNNVDVVGIIKKYNREHQYPFTHAVISAPWLSKLDAESLVKYFKDIQFVILSHSNVAFLQADAGGVRKLRQYAELGHKYKNLRVGGNCAAFVEWFRAVYQEPCELLPNLYPCAEPPARSYSGGTLRIGAFGALRPEKNFMTAGAAALMISRCISGGVPVELHMNSGGENNDSIISNAIREMTAGIPDFKLVTHHWDFWDNFIRTIRDMHLMIQVSHTESFNMVTADGISQGVPSVVSSVIRWAPDAWKADQDRAFCVAQKGLMLLCDSNAGKDGYEALERHNRDAVIKWKRFLGEDY